MANRKSKTSGKSGLRANKTHSKIKKSLHKDPKKSNLASTKPTKRQGKRGAAHQGDDDFERAYANLKERTSYLNDSQHNNNSNSNKQQSCTQSYSLESTIPVFTPSALGAALEGKGKEATAGAAPLSASLEDFDKSIGLLPSDRSLAAFRKALPAAPSCSISSTAEREREERARRAGKTKRGNMFDAIAIDSDDSEEEDTPTPFAAPTFNFTSSAGRDGKGRAVVLAPALAPGIIPTVQKKNVSTEQSRPTSTLTFQAHQAQPWGTERAATSIIDDDDN